MNTNLELMETYYECMKRCSSTSGRRAYFEKMNELYCSDKAVREVWIFQSVRYYTKRFVKRAVWQAENGRKNLPKLVLLIGGLSKKV